MVALSMKDGGTVLRIEHRQSTRHNAPSGGASLRHDVKESGIRRSLTLMCAKSRGLTVTGNRTWFHFQHRQC